MNFVSETKALPLNLLRVYTNYTYAKRTNLLGKSDKTKNTHDATNHKLNIKPLTNEQVFYDKFSCGKFYSLVCQNKNCCAYTYTWQKKLVIENLLVCQGLVTTKICLNDVKNTYQLWIQLQAHCHVAVKKDFSQHHIARRNSGVTPPKANLWLSLSQSLKVLSPRLCSSPPPSQLLHVRLVGDRGPAPRWLYSVGGPRNLQLYMYL